MANYGTVFVTLADKDKQLFSAQIVKGLQYGSAENRQQVLAEVYDDWGKQGSGCIKRQSQNDSRKKEGKEVVIVANMTENDRDLAAIDRETVEHEKEADSPIDTKEAE